MSDPEESNVLTLDVTNAQTLNELFQRLEEADVFKIVESVTFDTRSQKVIFHLYRLLEARAEEVHHQHSADQDSADAKIRNLSEIYKVKYPELLEYFKDWQPLRKTLIKLLGTSSHNLERNSSILSGCRIFTSAADIIGTIMRCETIYNNALANLLMENASVCGLVAIFVEMALSKKIHCDVKKALMKDQECFEKIVQWFKQTEELDAVVRNFFPYGIDKDLVKQIDACSDSSINDYQKLFTAVVTSNVKRNVKLFKNKEFLDTAECFATSEAGKMWFHKVLLESDHLFVHSLNSTLCDDIQALLKISPTENRELYVDSCRVLTSTVRMKVILNVITIMSSVSNLWLEERPGRSDICEKLLKSTSEEFEKVRNIVLLLNPFGSQIDPILQE